MTLCLHLTWRPSRRLVVVAALAAVTPVLAVAGANTVVLERAHGLVSSSATDLPHAQVAIVPGALVESDGRMSPILTARVDGAIALFRAGTVSRILVSGDHGHLGYDETDTMRDAVLAAGVPAADVFTDYAGFDTWNTMDRAARIFHVSSAIVVTQGFHVARAVDLGLAAGMAVHGLRVGGDGGTKGREAAVREVLARVKGLEEATLHPGVLLGPSLPITGDGRTSWGPTDPAAPDAYAAT